MGNDRAVGIALAPSGRKRPLEKKNFLSLKNFFKNWDFILTLESIPCKFQRNPSKKVAAA
jgi:hypothetical protein